MKSSLQARMKKIEGQVKGIAEMIESGRNCDEIIQQIIAVRSALASLGIEVVMNKDTVCKTKTASQDDIRNSLMHIFKLS